jgi:hypothetical protein
LNYTIEPFRDTDAESVALMSKEYFPDKGRASTDTICRVLRYQYLNNDKDRKPASIVCRDSKGNMAGFLGVTTIPFNYRGGVITGAYASDFMISMDARNSFMAFNMLREFLSGPQDFSFTDDANQTSRQLWERLGGFTAFSQSIYYKTPVRPVSFLTRLFVKEWNRVLGYTIHKSSFFADMVFGGLHVPRFRPEPVDVSYQPLSPDDLIKLMDLHMRGYNLHPILTKNGAKYYLDLIEMEKQYGLLYKAAVADNSGYAGWFAYYINSKGICSVLFSESLKGRDDLLFKSLVWHAYQKGGVELSGRLNPVQAGSWISHNSLLLPGRFWAMVYTKEKELLSELLTDKAFLRRI